MTGQGVREGRSILVRAVELLSLPLDVTKQLDALTKLLLPELADCCAVYLLSETDGALLTAVDHADPAGRDPLRTLLEACRVGGAQDRSARAAMETGRAQLTSYQSEKAANADDDDLARLRALGLMTGATLPLIDRGRVLGVLWLGRTRLQRWTDEDLQLLNVVITRVAGAVRNAQLYAGVLAGRQLLVDLQRITAGLAEATSTADVARSVVEQARAAIGADAALIAATSDERLDVLATSGIGDTDMQLWTELTVKGETLAGLALQRGQPLFICNRGELAEHLPDIVHLLPGEAHAALPLRRRGVPVGVVRFDWASPRRFDASDREFLLSVAQQAASALERAALLAMEQEARAEAEASRGRADLLAEITHTLSSSLDVDAVLDRLATLVVPRLADLCSIDLVDVPGEPARLLSIAAVTPELENLSHATDSYLPRRRNPKTMVLKALTSGETVLAPQVTEEHLRRISVSVEQAELYLEMDLRSGCVVPLTARGQVLGALSMFTTGHSERIYDESDAELMTEVGRRAGISVDNAMLFTREHEAAETLQRSLLPELPSLPGLDAAARYLPAAAHAGVGGDLFDLFALPDGATAIAIGDVMGHDMRAAAAMGQLRSVLRSYAWEGAPPGVVLDRMDLLVQNFEMAQLATALYARLEADPDGGGRLLRYANAGHLPPILQYPDGRARLLEDGRSVLIGAPSSRDTPARDEAVERVPVGSTLLLYTDGLIELKHRSLDEGIAELLAIVALHEPSAGAEALCAAVVASIDGVELIDDIALLAVRLL